jgi:hypothetical protein
VTLLPTRILDLYVDDTESVCVPATKIGEGFKIQKLLISTIAVPIKIHEALVTVIVAPGVPLPERGILVEIVPHARVTGVTGFIYGAMCRVPQLFEGDIVNDTLLPTRVELPRVESTLIL